jgi:DNA ligase D-like protein (predicted polymerase)
MAATAVELEAGDRVVRVSSPDKVMFPDQGWTKLDVAHHYQLTATGALRGVADRPVLFKRWPQGVGAEPFFQKRASKHPPMATADITFPSQRPGRMHVPRDAGDVLAMVQLNCLDLNPWPVRSTDIDHPDELRLDLDPTEGTDFEDVREVADVVREVLGEAGIATWPKTSGSRGIHVYARIRPQWTFYEVRRAVLAVAREVERRHPRATTKWWKEERDGVFLDYNQMAQDKTIASAYSVRPTGLVSAPFTWDELGTIDPWALDLASFPARWDRVGDPSDGIDERHDDIDPLLELVWEDEERGLGDAPWPPHYPKMPGEPPRVAPSRRRRDDES